MPIFGLSNGLSPIVGYNFGARNSKRIERVVKFALFAAMIVMLAGTAIFQIFTPQLFSLFNPSEEMLAIGIPALRIISSCFVFAAVSIVFSTVFQAIGNGVLSLILSVTRQLIVILPVASFMAKYMGLPWVWTAYPISEFVCTTLSILLFVWVYRKTIKPLVPVKAGYETPQHESTTSP
jgi:Na+-driven multidrug efflux pump